MPPVKRNAIERRDAYIATMDRLGNEPIVLEVSARSWDFEAIGFEEKLTAKQGKTCGIERRTRQTASGETIT
jgi:hypothetical protein